MTRHDERRRQKSINALRKAKECLEMERIYLNDQHENWRTYDDLELVDIALEKLTAEGGEGK